MRVSEYGVQRFVTLCYRRYRDCGFRAPAFALRATAGPGMTGDRQCPLFRAIVSTTRRSSTGRRCKLPGGARIVVWTIVNLEVWDIGSRWRGRCCRRRPGSRCCPTCRTGPGTNTGCGSACGASSICIAGSASARRSRSMRGCARTTSASPRKRERRLGVHGPLLRAGADPQGARPGAMISRAVADPGTFTGERPVGWLGPGLTADRGDAGAARRRRHQIYRRLGL